MRHIFTYIHPHCPKINRDPDVNTSAKVRHIFIYIHPHCPKNNRDQEVNTSAKVTNIFIYIHSHCPKNNRDQEVKIIFANISLILKPFFKVLQFSSLQKNVSVLFSYSNLVLPNLEIHCLWRFCDFFACISKDNYYLEICIIFFWRFCALKT